MEWHLQRTWHQGQNPNRDLLQEVWDFLRMLSSLQCKAKSTVSSNLTGFRKGMQMADDLGINPPYKAWGPWSLWDTSGFSVTLQIVRASSKAGTYSKESQTFNTIRQLGTM
eukprot:8377557-Ditylum_brightwellii.AAC.1